MKKPKIYDCFTYFNEDRLLQLRLETLWEHVDFFVICESILTHTGKPKEINFDIKKFAKYQEKIRYLLIDSYTFTSSNPWVYENYQRNYLMNGLSDAVDDDWIMVSDLDEIPNPAVIEKFNPKKYVRASLEQFHYVYFLNNMALKGGKPWMIDVVKITTFKALKDIFKCPNDLRNFKSSGIFRGLKKNWVKYFRTQLIKNGGWHFTWMGGVEKILEKMDAMAHQELNLSEYKNADIIKQRIYSGLEAIPSWNPSVSYQVVSAKENMPDFICTHKYDYEDLLLPETTLT
jgi:beta-1,4-mannosyl-glycoprotein beta-1,4-N-acetylglucosaminyltransferase